MQEADWYIPDKNGIFRRGCAAFFSALCCVVLFAVAPVGADSDTDAAKSHSPVHLRIRAVHALGFVEGQELAGRGKILVDTRLRDLDRELHSFPFRIYQLLDDVSVPVSPRRKEEIRLVTGQSLKLRLLSVNASGILLWLRWQDKEGSLLLDTRVHLSYGENVLAGAENLNSSGAVLAISAANPSG